MNKEAIKQLVADKQAIIKKKRSMPVKRGLAVGWENQGAISLDKTKALKMEEGEMKAGAYVDVKVIANLSGWLDSDDDVILRGAYTKTIKDKGPSKFPFLKDHKYSVDSIIGDTLKVDIEEYRLMDLGYNSPKTSQALMFQARVWKDYDKAMYYKYMNNAIKQHSIGLQYVKMELAVNDPEFEHEYKIWQQYSDQVVNIDKAEEIGYFWAVQEIKLLENSAVVFGANPMTPTISAQQGEKSEAATGTSASEEKEVAVKSTSENLEFFKHL